MTILRDMTGEPDSLTALELDLHVKLITYDPRPKKACPWVRYSGRTMKVNVYVLAWRRNAVRVRCFNEHQDRQAAWVWPSAV
jgi:hypothetical protein